MAERSLAAALPRLIAAAALAVASVALPARALETSFVAPGAPEDIADRLRAASTTLSAETVGLETSQEIIAAALSDYRTLVQVLYDAGYFSPVVNIRLDGREAADIPLIDPPGAIRSAEIRVETGPAFRFGVARVAPVPEGTDLPDGFAPGKPAGTGVIREATAAGREAWREEGHAKAAVGEQSITADARAARLDADIRLVPGPLLRFGELRIVGNEDVRSHAIRRIAGLPSGEVYSPAAVQAVGTRLRRTGTFASVAVIEAETPNADGTLDITAEVEEQLPRRISFGGEIQSNDGATVSAAWLHRNLLGNAERLRIEGEVGNIGGTEPLEGFFGIRLDLPARLGGDNNLFYLFNYQRNEREHYTLDRVALGVGVRRIFNSGLIGEAALTLSAAEADDAYGTDRRFDMISLPVRLTWDQRDSELNPTGGYFIEGSVNPFLGFQESDTGLQMRADGRYYRALTQSKSVVAAARLQLGSVIGAGASATSPDLLFFTGGAGTVRGQPYESLGIPVNGDIAGGRSYLAASAEIRARAWGPIGIVAFYDFAMVDTASFVSGDARSHSGAGLGVRYDLGGFGPIRLDLALPVSGDTEDGLQFYLGIGQAF